ncbi:tobamovirus multiplication protein 1-like isoform x1 [Anaeramoeba ignava]|uniref:Tobamovirus multiplication protein 1-like isoform x1 n=1 Tax=Anaeramoeba ignava TaxID=1746090 RepID=A0A9Q0LE49_ANAIG|nr:tobamovirus multiplication protein 1-like isoform x1 [Anaeramoeba ignava]
MTDSKNVLFGFLMFFFIFLFVIAIWKLTLLFLRTPQLYHQKIFFFLISIGSCGRIVCFFFQTFFWDFYSDNSKNTFNPLMAFFSDFFLSAFFTLIFTLAQVNFQVKNFSPLDAKHQLRNFIIVFTLTNVVVYAVHIPLIATHTDKLNFFLVSMYSICAIGLLGYSSLLLSSFYKKRPMANVMIIKKIFYVLLASTICYILRIPILIIGNLNSDDISDNQYALISFFYYLICEILPLCLIIFVLFVSPPKRNKYEITENNTMLQ